MPANLPKVNQRTIDSFRSRLVGGGARPNLFEVKLVYPEGIAKEIANEELALDTRFMVKAATYQHRISTLLIFHSEAETSKLLEIEHSMFGQSQSSTTQHSDLETHLKHG